MIKPFVDVEEGLLVELSANEVDVLLGVSTLLDGVIAEGEDAAWARLNPAAYPADAEADHEFRELVSDEFAQGRLADRSAFQLTLEHANGGVIVSPDEAEAWLRVLGETRLLLGARLGIDPIEVPAAVEMRPLYDYLTWLQGELVNVLTARLGR